MRLQDLDQLVTAARESSDLGHFAAELALDPPQSSADLAGPPHLDEDYLVLSTIHSAKGLEWDGVHVLALYDGNFPACMSAGTSESIDEERRLLYVALTRARRQLHLYVPVRYYHRPHGIDDAHGYGKPSRFLTDERAAAPATSSEPPTINSEASARLSPAPTARARSEPRRARSACLSTRCSTDGPLLGWPSGARVDPAVRARFDLRRSAHDRSFRRRQRIKRRIRIGERVQRRPAGEIGSAPARAR